MGYMLDVRKNTLHKGATAITLGKLNKATSSVLRRLNATVGKTLNFVLLSDSRGLNLPETVFSAMTKTPAKMRPLKWEVRICVRILSTCSQLSHLFMLATSDRLHVGQSDINPLPECPICLGHGSIRESVRQSDSARSTRLILHSMTSRTAAKLLPNPIRISLGTIQKGLDEMRGRGEFDDLLKQIQSRLLSMGIPLYRYLISVESRIILRTGVIFVPLGLIRLPPLLYVGKDGSIPASSRWEAAQITGKKYPIKVFYFKACPACLGLGVKCDLDSPLRRMNDYE